MNSRGAGGWPARPHTGFQGPDHPPGCPVSLEDAVFVRLVASGPWAQAWPSSRTRGQSVRTVHSDPEDPPHPHGHPRRSPGAREAGAVLLH